MERYSIVSPTLPTGTVNLKFNFIKTGLFKGTGELYVNGKKVAEGDIPQMARSTFSLSETFDVGVDNGTPVSNTYKMKNHFPYTAELDKVVITLTGEDTDKDKETNMSGEVD
jgi:arylsulfatase